MSLRDLLKDMRRLETNLQRFEARFGVKSLDFYDAMLRGELEEFDALDDYRMDFVEWLALYKTWTSFDERYRQLMARQPVALQSKDRPPNGIRGERAFRRQVGLRRPRA
jgi:hypothetical protein